MKKCISTHTYAPTPTLAEQHAGLVVETQPEGSFLSFPQPSSKLSCDNNVTYHARRSGEAAVCRTLYTRCPRWAEDPTACQGARVATTNFDVPGRPCICGFAHLCLRFVYFTYFLELYPRPLPGASVGEEGMASSLLKHCQSCRDRDFARQEAANRNGLKSSGLPSGLGLTERLRPEGVFSLVTTLIYPL